MTDPHEEIDFTHPDMQDAEWTPKSRQAQVEIARWPSQKAKKGPARAVSWQDILTVVDEGIKAVYFGRRMPWYELRTYSRYGSAYALLNRLNNEYSEELPLGTWEFQVESDKERGEYTLQAKYSPKRFSDVASIEKVPQEVKEGWLDLLKQYAERVRKERETSQENS